MADAAAAGFDRDDPFRDLPVQEKPSQAQPGPMVLPALLLHAMPHV